MSSYTFERIINVNNEKIFVNIHDKLPNIMECVNINTGEYYTKTWTAVGKVETEGMGILDVDFYDTEMEDDWREVIWEIGIIENFGNKECVNITESEWRILKNKIIDNKIELFWTGTANIDYWGEDWRE